MSTASSYAYMQTRLNMLAGRLLAFDDLMEMVAQDLDQVIARINATQGRDSSLLAADDVSAGQILSQHMFNDFDMLLRPFHGVRYRFLKHAIRWFELVNVKVLIRGKFTGVPEQMLAEQLVELGHFADLPLRQLLETDDPFEMLRLLEHTTYGGIVRQARRVFEEEGHELFSLDSAIDRTFFIELAHRARFLPDDDRELLPPVFGVLMDRFNLLWLLRFRFSYGLTPAKSYYLLTATGKYLHSTELMQLARLGSFAEVMEQLPDKLRQVLGQGRDMFQVEQLMELYSLSAARQGLFKTAQPVVRMFSYLLLREAETRYLIAIVKGKRLGFDQELINLAITGAA